MGNDADVDHKNLDISQNFRLPHSRVPRRPLPSSRGFNAGKITFKTVLAGDFAISGRLQLDIICNQAKNFVCLTGQAGGHVALGGLDASLLPAVARRGGELCDSGLGPEGVALEDEIAD